MDLNQFDYPLPKNLIAQYPLEHRASSRLLTVRQDCEVFGHCRFRQIDRMLNPGDLLVVNDTKVVPARLYARKPTGGAVEIMLERIENENTAWVMLGCGKPVKPGQLLIVAGYQIEVVEKSPPFFLIRMPDKITSRFLFESLGCMPLPPYIERSAGKLDSDRYQTVYCKAPGAVAAPTAGLHFDQDLMDKISSKGVQWSSVTLHVGAGTFQPVRAKNVLDHSMHKERVVVSEKLCRLVRRTRSNGGRIVAVGTTVVRALESAGKSGSIMPFSSETDLFIYPGYKFKIADALITNFHLPKSTLLIMVCAFAGRRKIMDAYTEAINLNYRFFSYGDAMFLERKN